jgi:hypothetical protein
VAWDLPELATLSINPQSSLFSPRKDKEKGKEKMDMLGS